MNDWERAQALMTAEGYTCVLCGGDLVYTSRQRGIAPVLGYLEDGVDLQGFAAADKIVGKAAALLFVQAGVQAVYGAVMSKGAQTVLERFDITYAYGTLTEGIINRAGDGLCPMEQTVAGIEEPQAAQAALRLTLAALQKKNGRE